ncbi:MAG TPA: hypothetical protein VIV11_02275 [Kofleriaceae bacterium]
MLRLPIARRSRRLLAALPLAALLLAACVREAKPTRTASDDIISLWAQIRAWRAEAGLALDPTCVQLVGFAPAGSSTVRDCSHVPSRTALTRGDTCSLGDAICDNAETICTLAGELGDNMWAQDKCVSAKASCREIKSQCFGAVGQL